MIGCKNQASDFVHVAQTNCKKLNKIFLICRKITKTNFRYKLLMVVYIYENYTFNILLNIVYRL